MANILLIEARYYNQINDMIIEGVAAALEHEGHSHEVLTVPGALEIPAALKWAVQSGNNYDGYIVAGCVIRGETSHYDIVCNESARGVYDLVQEHDLALGNAILTVENQDQAKARADKGKKDKGGEATRTVLQMMKLKQKFNI